MLCPRCKIDLESRTIGGITVEDCHSCTGMWFDADELSAYTDMQLPQLQHADPDEQLQTVMEAREGYIQCPKCAVILTRYRFAYSSPVELDECLQCSGVWLDAGELNSIYAFLAAQRQSADDPQTQAAEAIASMQAETMGTLDRANRLQQIVAFLKMRKGVFFHHMEIPKDHKLKD